MPVKFINIYSKWRRTENILRQLGLIMGWPICICIVSTIHILYFPKFWDMNFKEFRRQLIWHFLGKYDNIFIYTCIHTYLSSHALTYACMHFVRVYLVFTVRLARRQMPLTSYREISAINAVRKIIFPQGQSH